MIRIRVGVTERRKDDASNVIEAVKRRVPEDCSGDVRLENGHGNELAFLVPTRDLGDERAECYERALFLGIVIATIEAAGPRVEMHSLEEL